MAQLIIANNISGTDKEIYALDVPLNYLNIDPSSAVQRGGTAQISNFWGIAYDIDHDVLWLLGGDRQIYSLEVPDDLANLDIANAVARGLLPTSVTGPNGITYDSHHAMLWIDASGWSRRYGVLDCPGS